MEIAKSNTKKQDMDLSQNSSECDPSLKFTLSKLDKKFFTGIRKIENCSERFGDFGDAWEDWIVIRRELVR